MKHKDTRKIENIETIQAWFNNQVGNQWFQSDFEVNLSGYDVPYVIYDDVQYSATLILNGSLQDCEFYKAKDTYTCYQELDMYISTQMAPEDNIDVTPISDELKAESHGFNKFSFRKEKGEKKRKQKSKKSLI